MRRSYAQRNAAFMRQRRILSHVQRALRETGSRDGALSASAAPWAINPHKWPVLLLERSEILNQIHQFLRGHRLLQARRHDRELQLFAPLDLAFLVTRHNS